MRRNPLAFWGECIIISTIIMMINIYKFLFRRFFLTYDVKFYSFSGLFVKILLFVLNFDTQGGKSFVGAHGQHPSLLISVATSSFRRNFERTTKKKPRGKHSLGELETAINISTGSDRTLK